MSSMENGSTPDGFHAICRSAAWRRQRQSGCEAACRDRARKASGGVYDEITPATRQA